MAAVVENMQELSLDKADAIAGAPGTPGTPESKQAAAPEGTAVKGKKQRRRRGRKPAAETAAPVNATVDVAAVTKAPVDVAAVMKARMAAKKGKGKTVSAAQQAAMAEAKSKKTGGGKARMKGSAFKDANMAAGQVY